MPGVEIVRIDRAPPDARALVGAAVDWPTAGERRSHFGLAVAGWTIAPADAAHEIELCCDGETLARWPRTQTRADVAAAYPHLAFDPVCGFIGVLGAVDLPESFALRVDAVVGASRAPIAVVHGRRSALVTPSPRETLRPALVTTLGRTGSTLLLLLLGRHPRVVAHPPFPYEARVAGYWTSIVRQLCSPASYLQALAAGTVEDAWWLPRPSFRCETYLEQDDAARWLGGEALGSLAGFARGQVQSFYGISQTLQAKPADGPSWFVEKQGPDRASERLQRALFPEARRIFLVRDFRDVAASIHAFDRKRGYSGFGMQARALTEPIDESYLADLGAGVDLLLDSWRHGGPERHLVRYEDLARDPAATLAGILRALDLDASADTVARMLEQSRVVDRDAQRWHVTSADTASSIGRWRHDLPRALHERATARFGAALHEWGYAI